MNTIQTHAAPDLLTVSKDDDGTLKLRLGEMAVPVRNVGRRENDSLVEVVISLEDLRRTHKSAYRLGWAHKCEHVRQLDGQRTKEIGS